MKETSKISEGINNLRIGPEEVYTPYDEDCEVYLPDGEEEQIEDPYSPARPFELRIYRAVDNYNKKKLTNMQRQIVAKYLAFGGIKTGQKPFVNSVDKSVQDVDKDLKVGAALDIKNDGESDDEVEVDFWSTIREFMVENLIMAPFSFEVEFHTETPKTIKDFLEFLKRASVCPEYNEDIDHSIKLCDRSLKELILVNDFAKAFPDKFNTSCSVRFGGNLYDYFSNALSHPVIDPTSEVPTWANIKFYEDTINLTQVELAQFTDKWKSEGVKIKQSIFIDMRVAGINDHTEFPSSSEEVAYDKVLLKRFSHHSLNDSHTRIISPHEFSADEYMVCSDVIPETMEIFLEKDLSNKELLGLVFSARFNLLSNGVWYVDLVNRLLPTFQFLDRPF